MLPIFQPCSVACRLETSVTAPSGIVVCLGRPSSGGRVLRRCEGGAGPSCSVSQQTLNQGKKQTLKCYGLGW